MRSRIWAAAVTAAGVLAGCVAGPGSDELALHPRLEDWPRTAVEVVTGDEAHEVAALVAAVPDKRQRGLQDVERVPDGAGMLFVFDRDRTSGFWMKDTLVPLEIAFATHEGRIVEVLSMEPCESDPCTVYRPDAAYRVALEVPDGWFSERGVGTGDHLEFDWDEIPEPR
jgi:uncharacterized protein